MKKISLLLTILTLCLSFVGCGNKETILTESDFEIKEATLLSIEEYENYKELIPYLVSSDVEEEECWWLRSPGLQRYGVAIVYNGDINEGGINYDFGAYDVRPALKIEVSSANAFKAGSKLELLDKKWTILNISGQEAYILCDESIGRQLFDDDSNDWETSELKQWLEEQF